MSPSANVTQWLSWALLILTGSMNRPGGVWFHPGFAYQLETFELPVSPPEGSFGPGPRSRPETQSFLGEWPCAVLPDEINAGNIRAFLNLGGSLVTAFPDAGSLVPALKQARRPGDHRDPPQRDDGALDARAAHQGSARATRHHAVGHPRRRKSPRSTRRAVVAPVGERRSMWWVLAEIGRRLGHELADTSATDEAMLALVGSGVRGGYDELTANGWAEAPLELPAPWVENHVERMGGWRLAPRLLVEQLDALPKPAPLVLVPRRQMSRLNSQLEFLGEALEVVVHPDNAAAAGLSDNAPLIVRSEHGQLTGVAKVDASVRRGAVSVPHGHAGANVNLLTSKDDIDLVTGMTRYSSIPVTLHPA